ncbi:hypothetical protein Asulf_01313 [Archaeoglobus sulfaticallidus PM70-1]|uniref:Uncharacterized protein n=1 Tax=Archaeoglobus sulfaticallidus PM70-1 TaxID=387631 RepID=N0BCG3_9EURY|nr:hypothetical protein [Archaeoglobus sulfaticallidus]AGK61304.1 hypothetical protein Asulf_01313 [Archaeoglobus sulfaticallidus PM70-1]
MVRTKKHGDDVYRYFRRREISDELIKKINGLTWEQAAKHLNVSIPGLFVFLEHARRVGKIKEVEVK